MRRAWRRPAFGTAPCRHDGTARRAWPVVALVVCVALVALLVPVTARADDPPAAAAALAAAIDAVVEAGAVGPLAPPCSDADFLRRVHLDLAGTIPSPERTRRFLADPSPTKRAALVDELLAAPAFARHFALALDAMLLERKNPGGDAAAWRTYLAEAAAADRPLDALGAECVAADGADPATRPAATFFLVREADPLQMTRSIGRVFFGRDLQCAQCHDHPNNADIRQTDYHALAAFLQRTSLFKAEGDPKAMLAEKADGETEFTSVFTKEHQKGVRPRLPAGGTLVAEPLPEAADAYLTAPGKNVRAVPAHSRRRTLAAMLGSSEEFRRTMANRLWALMTGRGQVHPLDGHDPDNAPAHPRLLALLADALRDGGFRAKPILRAIALSRTYQRSFEPPAIDAAAAAAAAVLADGLAAARPGREAEASALDERARAAESAFDALLEADRASLSGLPPLLEARDKARAAADSAGAEKRAADDELARRTAQSEALAGAAAKAAEAAKLLPDDKVLAGAAEIVTARAAEFAATLEGAKGAVAAKATALEGAGAALAAAREAVATALAARPAPAALAAAEAEAIRARAAWREARYALEYDQRRASLARDLAGLPGIAADPVAAGALRESIVARWCDLGQVARLRPLSPEQFAFAVLAATGAEASFRETAAKALARPEGEAAPSPEEAAARAVALEARTAQEAAGFLATVAGLQGDPLAGDFQTSVNQSLWLGNSPEIAGWLRPGGSNLAARVAALPDPAAMADEVVVSVLSRPANDAERAELAAVLASRPDDRPGAVAEFLWALLSSNEFRFNH